MSENPENTSNSEKKIRPRRGRTRIDQPHPVAAENAGPPLVVEEVAAEPAGWHDEPAIAEPSEELVAAIAGHTLEARREQLQTQASQLATHLRERLREVDRRESQLNARVAQLESDLRAARLWQREKEHDFIHREAELRQQIDDLTVRLGEAGDRGEEAADFETRLQELLGREQRLQLKENELRERRFEVERQAAALRHAQLVTEQQREHEQTELARERERLTRDFADRIAAREEQLRASELLIVEHTRQLESDRAALAAEQTAWRERSARERDALAAKARTLDAQFDDRTQRLDARQEWVERQKAGLDQVRGEIMALHRQSLEMRLIAEQLWSQISGRMTPTEVTHAISQLRLKLAEHYKLEDESLVARRKELVDLGERLDRRYAELTQLRTGLTEWVATRQSEIEQQAARLCARELELDDQQAAFRRSEQAWNAERRAFEQQLRDLTAQIRAPAQLAAA